MREILFRMYDDVKMVYDGLVIYNGELYEDWRAFEDGIKSDNPLMQYTGLEDTNGQRIFEGDVVRCCGGEYYQGIYEFYEDVEVKFETYALSCLHGADLLEVIGNIHDNPEVTE